MVRVGDYLGEIFSRVSTTFDVTEARNIPFGWEEASALAL